MFPPREEAQHFEANSCHLRVRGSDKQSHGRMAISAWLHDAWATVQVGFASDILRGNFWQQNFVKSTNDIVR
jgi:hypothetical protein